MEKDPEYKSFRLAKGWGTIYRWQPLIAIVLMFIVAFGVLFFIEQLFVISNLLAFVIFVVVLGVSSILYNRLARVMSWQQLHWSDILFVPLP